MKARLLAAILFAVPLAAQTVNPNQIRPSATNGQVLTTVGGNTVWSNTSGGPLIEHNGTPVPLQTILNFDDTVPAPPTGDQAVTFQTDSTGKVSAYVPLISPSLNLQMQVIPPVAGQHVIIYPTTITAGGSGSVGATGNTSLVGGTYCAFGGSGFINTSGYVLPSYVNPANVTAVYAFAMSANYSLPGSGFCLSTPKSASPFEAVSITPTASGVGSSADLIPSTAPPGGGGAWGLQQVTASFPVTGANISTTAINAAASVSTDFLLGQEFDMPTVGLIVYYTGTAPPANGNIQVMPPLNFANNTLSINPTGAFPGQYLLPWTVATAKVLAASSLANSLFLIDDGVNSTDCATGGGTNKVLCVWNGTTTLNAFSSGGGGGGNTTSTSLTTNVIPKANGANSIINSGLSDNGTILTYSGSGTTNGISFPASTTPFTPVSGTGFFGTDSSGNTIVSENGAALSRICTAANGICASGSLANNVLLNSPSTGLFFANGDSIGLISNGGFPEKLATLLTTPSGNQKINAIGSASLADMLSCDTPGSGSCTQDGTLPLSFPLGVTSNSKGLIEFGYNDLSNMGATPTNTQLSYFAGGLKAWLLEFGIPDSQKLAANGSYCTTTGTWTAVSSVPGGAGTFPAGTLQTTTPGATMTCTTHNATDAGIIGYKYTGSTTATFTVSIVNSGTTYNVADPYTGSTTLNQTAAYTSAWAGKTNFYAVGQSGMAGGYTTITLTAASNSSDPVIVVAPYFISPSSSLQNFPAVEVMLESRAGCNGTCSTVAGPLHSDANTNVMRGAQISVVNELRSNGLNVSYFDPNATPSGYNSSDTTQSSDGTHPLSSGPGAQNIANTAFVNLNSAATTQDHFLPIVGGGSPGGTSGAIQFNNSGAFGGSAATVNAAGNILTPGKVVMGSPVSDPAIAGELMVVNDVGGGTGGFVGQQVPSGPANERIYDSVLATLGGHGNLLFRISNDTYATSTTWLDVLRNGTTVTSITVPTFTDSALTSGNCVQASTGGLLTTTAGPCSGGGVSNTTITIGSGVAFTANTCSSYTGTAGTASTTTMTGVTTGMTFVHTPTTDVHAVTGWSPAAGGSLYFTSFPTANTLNDYVCNPTNATITTGASVTWNVSAR